MTKEEYKKQLREYELQMRYGAVAPLTGIQALMDASVPALDGLRTRRITADDLLRAVDVVHTASPIDEVEEFVKQLREKQDAIYKNTHGGGKEMTRREYNLNPTVREIPFIGDAVIINPEMVKPEAFGSEFRRIMYDKFYLIDYSGTLMNYIKRGAQSDFRDWSMQLYHPGTNKQYSFEVSKLLFINDSMVNYTSYKLKKGSNFKFVQIYEGDTLKKLNERNNLNNLVINEGWQIVDRIHMNEEARLKDWQTFIDEYCKYSS